MTVTCVVKAQLNDIKNYIMIILTDIAFVIGVMLIVGIFTFHRKRIKIDFAGVWTK